MLFLTQRKETNSPKLPSPCNAKFRHLAAGYRRFIKTYYPPPPTLVYTEDKRSEFLENENVYNSLPD